MLIGQEITDIQMAENESDGGYRIVDIEKERPMDETWMLVTFSERLKLKIPTATLLHSTFRQMATVPLIV